MIELERTHKCLSCSISQAIETWSKAKLEDSLATDVTQMEKPDEANSEETAASSYSSPLWESIASSLSNATAVMLDLEMYPVGSFDEETVQIISELMSAWTERRTSEGAAYVDRLVHRLTVEKRGHGDGQTQSKATVDSDEVRDIYVILAS